MHIREREAGDEQTLRRLARAEKDAEQKDRYLVVVHALRGRETGDIQEALARSRGFVQRWAYAYRDGGIGALRDKPRGGSRPRINDAAAERLMARLDAGPRPGDGVCTLRGRDIRRIAKDELGVELSLSSVYRTLERLGYACLAPRPRHEKQDLEAQRQFKEERAPLLSAPSPRRWPRTAGGSAPGSWTRPASGSRAP
jgi:transposase